MRNLNELESLHFLEQLATHLGRASGDDHAGSLERVDLVLSASFAAGDDGTSVTHATAGWSGQPGDERDDRLGFDALEAKAGLASRK